MFCGLYGKNEIRTNSINNNSLVIKLNYKKFSMLFTGDIEEIAEKSIVTEYVNNLDNQQKDNKTVPSMLNATVLKVAHHGSKTSSSLDFLGAVNPRYAVIGVGKNNTFGHPSDITIQRLENQNVRIFRTDEMGEITIKTNGSKINFFTQIGT